MELYRLKACRRCGGDLAQDDGDWICLQCGAYCYVGIYPAAIRSLGCPPEEVDWRPDDELPFPARNPDRKEAMPRTPRPAARQCPARYATGSRAAAAEPEAARAFPSAAL